jgi:gluconolactonase
MFRVLDPSFHDLVAQDAKLEKLATGFEFTEGPVWSRRGYTLFSDVRASRIHKFEAGKTTVFRENSNRANGLTFDHQGRLLTCERGRVTRTEKNGSITVLAEKGLTAPNDLVYAIDAHIYFTDLLPRDASGPSTVYQITRKGELRVASRECEGPNGIALSANQQRLFVADSRKSEIRVFDIHDDGSLSAGKVFATISERGPDGLKTDEGGNVWVAAPGGIWVFNAAGKHLGVIETPESPSNLSFGDGFRALYITARTSLYHIRVKVAGTRTY